MVSPGDQGRGARRRGGQGGIRRGARRGGEPAADHRSGPSALYRPGARDALRPSVVPPYAGIMGAMPPDETNAVPLSGKRRRRWPWVAMVVVVLAAGAAWWWSDAAKKQDAQAARRPAGAIPVVTAKSEARDVPVKLKANGTVTALQSVDLRAQITSTVKEVHIREGQNVGRGDLLFTFDDRAEEANLHKAMAQVEKDKADLATAARNLERQRELFRQKFISQAALDTAQNQVDTLQGQLAVDTAAGEREPRGPP